MAMTVREQLAEQLSRPRPVKQQNYVTSLSQVGKVKTLLLAREIRLTVRMRDPSPLTKLVKVGAVNAAKVWTIPVHHLLITRFWIDPPDMASMNAASDYAVHIELLDYPLPISEDSEVDFDAILAAIDSELEAPPVSWHDQPGLL